VTAVSSRVAPRRDAIAAESTRERLLDAALRLFSEHSFAGTSLQMIADELGITKAAVYHHFHTRDELLSALITPALAELLPIVEDATALRTPQARADRMLTGFVDLAVRHRTLVAILGTDRAILQVLTGQGHFDLLVERPIALLGGTASGSAGRINATIVLSGIASTVGSELLADLDDETMRARLVEAGRRILGLRPPRRTSRRP
jgi:AcrR family transcriptional regulator